MTLEINEIGIRMKVGDIRDNEDESAKEKQASDEMGCGDAGREEIVEDCVERVLQILRTYMGR